MTQKLDLPVQTLETASQEVTPLLEAVYAKFGKIPNIIGTMANAPVTLQSYLALGGNFAKAGFTPLEQQIIFLTISLENGCDYCTAAHSTALTGGLKQTKDRIDTIRSAEPLEDARLEALITTVRELVRRKGYLAAPARDAFFNAGYSQTQLIDLLSAIAMKTLTNYLDHLADITIDPAYAAQAV
jgi:AhpD family alkylhydroperoxidase